MTNRELCEKYGCCAFANGKFDLDAEADPKLEEILKELQEESEYFDNMVKGRAKNEAQLEKS